MPMNARSSRCWRQVLLAALASSALSLTACAPGNKLATFGKGDAPLDVDLPDVCEGFLTPVTEPIVTRKTDARVAVVRYAGAFHEANSRIGAGRDCERDERAIYRRKTARGKPR